MATQTTNYNLSKPEATDPFSQFRQSYNDNLDIIDANLGGGGGGGGHTIIDPNGSDMAQRAGLQFTGSCSVMDDSVNDKTVVNISGGGGNVYGAFLDPSRVIYSAFTFDSSAHTWTATEDVILTDNLHPVDGSTASYILIDGKGVFASYTFGDPFVYVKKGQVVTYRGKSGSNMKAYGILQGTSGIFAPVIYSDTERKIGIWRDNKPLYQKTIEISQIPNQNTQTIAHGIANVDRIVDIKGICYARTDIDPNYASTPLPRIQDNSTTANLGVDANRTNIVLKGRGTDFASIYAKVTVTLQYTKTTDSAGSGDWNTDGVPTVHYDNTEKVIGTWFGKPLYQKTIVKNNIAMGNNGGTLTSIAHGVSDLKECVRLNMSCPKLGYCTGDNLTSTAGVVIATFRVDGTSVYCSGGTNYFGATNDRYWYITIQYTKTTD